MGAFRIGILDLLSDARHREFAMFVITTSVELNAVYDHYQQSVFSRTWLNVLAL